MGFFLGQYLLYTLKVVLITLEGLVVVAHTGVVEDQLAQIATAESLETICVHLEVVEAVPEEVVLRDPIKIDQLDVGVDTLVCRCVLCVAWLLSRRAGFIAGRSLVRQLDPVLGQRGHLCLVLLAVLLDSLVEIGLDELFKFLIVFRVAHQA